MKSGSDDLKSDAIIGFRFSAASKIFEVIVILVVAVVMARLLEPKDFGVIAMCSIFTGISAIFIEFGTGDAIIRHDEDKTTNEFLSSIFWINIFIGIIVSAILILLSGPIAIFFNYEIIQKIIVISSISIIFSAISIVPRSILRKRLDFKSIFYQRAIVLSISGVIGISLALKGYGIWSLVAHSISVSTGGAIMLLYFSKWMPKFVFKQKHIKEIWHFSTYLSYSKFFNYFTKKGDMFLIGKFIGDYSLGIYSKGYQLTVQMLKTFNGAILTVVYPTISKIKKDKKRLQSTFLEVSQVIFTIYSTIALLGFLFSENAVKVVLGDKWIELVPLIPIFLLLALFFALGSVGSHYLKAMGRSKLIFKITIITSVLTVVSFVIGLKWGIYGIALGYLFSTAVLFALLIYKSLGILEIGIKVYISIFAKETVILLLSVVLIKLLFTLITVESDFFRLLIGVSSILIIQSLYHYLFRTTIYKYLKLFIEGAKTT